MRKIAISFFIEPDKHEALKTRGESENKHMSALIREAIDDKYFSEKPSLKLSFTPVQKKILHTLNLDPSELTRVAISEWFSIHFQEEVLETIK